MAKNKKAAKKATPAKKVAPAKKARPAKSKKVAKVVSIDCPDLTNKKDKTGNVIIPTAIERNEKRRQMQAYLRNEKDANKRNEVRRAFSNWFKGKAA